jgi:hypothetical protein
MLYATMVLYMLVLRSVVLHADILTSNDLCVHAGTGV